MKQISVCIYGGASDAVDAFYLEQGRKLGEKIAQMDWRMVYGGGAGGMMGACARGALSAGGTVIGVVPHFLHTREKVLEECIQIHTETMADRKQVMEENSDAFIIVPGGVGTMDEFFQILTLKDLERHQKPVILFNIKGYYDSLIQFVYDCARENFIRKEAVGMFKSCESVPAMIEMIEEQVRKG